MLKAKLLILILTGSLTGLCAQNQEMIKKKPNVIIFYIDDMGYADIGCFGNQDVPTPNIDLLATQGMVCTQYYSNSPICSPSRVALLTGQYPQRHRIHSFLAERKRNAARGMKDFLDPEVQTLAKALKHNGYRTAHYGKWHMGGGRDVDDAPTPDAYGYDESWVDLFEGMGPGMHHRDMPRPYNTDVLVNRAMDFMARSKRDGQPFFINISPNDVHDPHDPKEEYFLKFTEYQKGPYNFDQRLYAVIANLDVQVGRVIRFLEDAGMRGNTIIIFTSDNGPTDWAKYYEPGIDQPPGSVGPLRGRKWSLYEGGIRMPFVISYPDVVPRNTRYESAVCAIDLLPSLINLTSSEMPEGYVLDGKDKSSVFRTKKGGGGDPIYWEYGSLDAEFLRPGTEYSCSPDLAMLQGKWKLLMNYDGSDVELYDLNNDISETTNLAEKEKAVTARMMKSLKEWRETIFDKKD